MTTLVIGAGITGLSISFRLATAGEQVVLFDPDPSGGAARASGGIVTFNTVDQQHTGRSIDRNVVKTFNTMLTDIEAASGLRVEKSLGLLRVAAASSTERHDTLTHAASAGIVLEELDRSELLSLAPALGPAVQEGLWSEHEFTLDPGELLDALYHTLRVLGVQVIRETVCAVHSRHGSVVGVETSGGTVTHGSRVITCVGASQSVLETAVCENSNCACTGTPATPIRGMTMDVISDPLLTQRTPVLGLDKQMTAGILPLGGSHYRIGASSADVGWAQAPQIREYASIISDASTIFPSLAEAQIIARNIAFRPRTANSQPIITACGTTGLFIVNGLYRSGVALAGAVSEAATDVILERPIPQWAHPLISSNNQ